MEWSKLLRLMVGDQVTITHDGHIEGLVENEDIGEVVGFANDTLTHLTVDFGEKGVHTLTEEELRRVA